MDEAPAYGLWSLVVINSAIFIIFAFSFSKPQTQRDWRSFGAFSAFIVALFVEMYGFPLTIYLISGWLLQRYPNLDLFSHDAGHLWNTLLGWDINPHFDPLHILSNVLIFGGFILLSAAWKVLYEAQKTYTLATTGPYAYVRHPQYVGFMLIMLGFLLQWPTLITLIMFPILVAMYVKLARREEQEVLGEFGDEYRRYMSTTQAFIPRMGAYKHPKEVKELRHSTYDRRRRRQRMTGRKLIALVSGIIILVGFSGYSPAGESGESSQQRAPATGSEMGPPHGMGAGGGYGPGYSHGMGPGMMGPGWSGGYGMGPGMMGPGMMGPGMMSPGMGGGLGPGMGMMGSMMSSVMGSPQMMGAMMSMHGDMMALMGRMIQRYGGEQSPEAQQKMRTEMLQEMGDILIKHGNRLKETAKASAR